MSENALLRLLCDGQFHSDEAVASVTDTARSALPSALRELQALGLQVESVAGQGHRIPGGIDLLQADVVRAHMTVEARALLQGLEVLHTIDSTNTEAMRNIKTKTASAGQVYTAEQQTAGRGRRGREWVSPFARNIYVSTIWQFDTGGASVEGLSLAVGVAVARALQTCGIAPIQLKWPNDVLADGSKLGGILLEMTGDASTQCQVVVGVGLNVAMPADSAGAIDQAWTDVATLAGGQSPKRNSLLAQLLNELLPLLAGFEAQGFAAWRDAWNTLDAHADTPVILHTGSSQLAGVARGVDQRGALQLETTLGVQSVFGGEVSLRVAT